MGNFDGCCRARELPLDASQVTKNMAAVCRGFPRTIRYNPINFAENSFPQGGTYEISDRNVLAGGNPPHVVMRVHMNQDAAGATGITPNRQRFVVVLNAENSTQRSIQRFAFRGSQKQFAHFNSGTCLTNKEDELRG
jgi:hypothetical protein